MNKFTFFSIVFISLVSSLFTMGCGDATTAVKCSTDSCKNGGVCKDEVKGYVCTCPEGFKGKQCEQPKKCAELPGICKNGGICSDKITGGVTCNCAKGFIGNKCEIVQKCSEMPSVCLNGGSCIDDPKGLKCHCPDGFDGRLCEHEKPFIIKVKGSEFSIASSAWAEKRKGILSLFDYNVDCDSDGKLEAEHVTKSAPDENGWAHALYVCKYSDSGEHVITISGKYPSITLYGSLIEVVDWGGSKWKSMSRMFEGCNELNKIPKNSVPDLSEVTDMSGMFSGATAFNQDISKWDVSHVTNMQSMFFNATSFNQDIGDWDVSNVRNATLMFGKATSFNANIVLWDVSNMRSMYGMFFNATSFNQDIDIWDVSNVRDMRALFKKAASFNVDISGWDVRLVSKCGSFNEDSPLSDLPHFTRCDPKPD